MSLVKKFLMSFLLLGIIIGMISCAGTEEEGSGFETYITILPDKKVSNTGPFELTISGTGFDSGTQIYFDGKVMATTFVGSSQLTCNVLRNDTKLSTGRSLSGVGSLNAPGDRFAEVYVKTSKGEESQRKEFTLMANYDFQPPVVLTDGATQTISDCDIYMDKNERIYVFWISKEGEGGGKYKTRITLVYSDDLGETWTDPRVIADRNYINDKTQYLLCDISKNDQINVIYGEHSWYWDVDEGVSVNKNLYYLKSTDNGNTWSSPVSIAKDIKAHDMVGSKGGRILVVGFNVWERNGDEKLYYVSSGNNGGSWGTKVLIKNQTQHMGIDKMYYFNHHPDLAVHQETERIHLLYTNESYSHQSRHFHQYTEDGGKNWSNPKQLAAITWKWNVPVPQNPNMALDSSGNIYATWNNEATANLSIANSKNNGESWKLLDTDALYRLEDSPKLIVGSSGNVNLFGNAYIRSTDNGASWSEQYQRWQHDFGKAAIDSLDTVYMVNIENNTINFFKSH